MSRNDSHEITPYSYGQLVFNKVLKTIQRGKNSHFNTVLGQLVSHMQKNEFGPPLHATYKIELKMCHITKCKG